MKYLSMIFSLVFILFTDFQVQAQHDHGSHGQKPAMKKDAMMQSGGMTDIFVVYGNSGMSKKRIEGALAGVKGVHSADWDLDTKVMTVKYDDEAISLDEIKKKIVATGHDTDKFRTTVEAYESLPGCCKYDRPAAAEAGSAAAEGTAASFTVYGNCGMCKRRIEGALKDLKGINSADWDSETKVLEVNYDASQTNMDEIQMQIAGVGHDTDKHQATTEAYDNLPGCCQFDRPKS
jgi:copper chaperone CopZ